MSRRLVIAPSAVADLTDIRDYLAESAGPQVATRVLTALYDAMARLAAGSAVGHARPDLAADPVRFYLVFRYFVVHRLDPADLFAFRVLHAARDVRSILT